jgi:hypothetical protein
VRRRSLKRACAIQGGIGETVPPSLRDSDYVSVQRYVGCLPVVGGRSRAATTELRLSQHLNFSDAADLPILDQLVAPLRLHHAINLLQRIECAFSDCNASVL